MICYALGIKVIIKMPTIYLVHFAASNASVKAEVKTTETISDSSKK